MNRSVCRLYLHVGVVGTASAWLVLLMLALKWGERYGELTVDEPGRLSLSAALVEGFWRRIDDPSLWAVIVAGVSGLWMLRAANKLTRVAPALNVSWIKRWQGWRHWLGAAILCSGIYLAACAAKSETFWYMNKTEHAKYAVTAIPLIQRIEGVANLFAIVLATSLFPPALRLLDALRVTIAASVGTAPSIHLLKAGTALANIGAMPVSLLAFAALNQSIFKVVVGQPIDAAAIDLISGIAGAMLICWPMLALTVCCWRSSMKLNPELGVLKVLHMPLWVICVFLGHRRLRPPCWITQPSALSPGVAKSLYALANRAMSLGSFVALWYDPKAPAARTGPPHCYPPQSNCQ